MKKLILAVLLAGLVSNAQAVCNPRTTTCMTKLDVSGTLDVGSTMTTAGSVSLYSRTLAQLNALTPTAVGQMLMCSNCTQSAVCISSGTGVGAFVVLAATGPFAGATFSGMPHCL